MVCCMLKRCPLHFGYSTKAHSCTAACVLSSYSFTPTHTAAYCWVLFFFPFLRVQFLGKFKKKINSFREGWHCSISAMMLVLCIFTAYICYITVHWRFVQHPCAAASCYSILHTRWPLLLVRRKHGEDALRNQPINLFQKASLPFKNL